MFEAAELALHFLDEFGCDFSCFEQAGRAAERKEFQYSIHCARRLGMRLSKYSTFTSVEMF